MATMMSNVQVVILILTTFIFVGGIIGNLFVATIILRRKRMQTITNWFVFNLSVCDLVIVLIVIPYNTIIPHVNWPFGTFGCRYITPGLEHFAGVCVLTHTCLGLMRYLVLRGATRGFVISINHVRVTTVLVWIIPFFTMSVSVMYGVMAHPNLVNLPNGITTCLVKFRGPEMKMAYKIMTFTLTYILPMIVTGFAYYKIHSMVSSSNKHLNGHMSENALQVRRSKTRRMNRALMVMYVMFGVTTLPIQMLYIIDTLGYIPVNSASHITHQFFVALFYGQVVTNPLVLFYMGEDYRKEIYRLPVCICRPKLRRLSTVTSSFYKFHASRIRSRRKSSSPTVLFGANHDSNSVNKHGVKKPSKSALLERNPSYDVYAVQNSYSQEHALLPKPETSFFEAANTREYLHCSSRSSDNGILPNGNGVILRNSLSSSKSNRSTVSSRSKSLQLESDSVINHDQTDTTSTSDNIDNIDNNITVDFKDMITSTPLQNNVQTVRPIRLTERFVKARTINNKRAVRAGEMTVSAYYDDGSLMYFYDSILGRVSLSDDNGRETKI